MENFDFIFDLAIILLSTKILGLITKKFHMPQVVGALLAGLIFGPACFNLIHQTDYIHATAEIGVIVLMFCAGMETDIKELKKSGKASFIIAVMGVIIPLVGGYLVGSYFNRTGRIESDVTSPIYLQNIFIGIILTATSVSITVETLKELGKLKTRSGNAILGAAIIDDILGIIGLTIITSMADASVNIWIVLLKIAAFFVFAAIAGVIFYRLFRKWSEITEGGMHRYVIIAFVFCLLMAYIGEKYFGVADITGAFIAGLILSNTQKSQYLASKFEVLSYLYLSPIFFASIGLKAILPDMNKTVLSFAIVLTLVAVLTKVIGCGLGAKLCRYENYQCARIGIGMISRGEVALIVASKGNSIGLLGANFLGPVVLVVIVTTIITPVLLKFIFKKGPNPTPIEDNKFSENYDTIEKMR